VQQVSLQMLHPVPIAVTLGEAVTSLKPQHNNSYSCAVHNLDPDKVSNRDPPLQIGTDNEKRNRDKKIVLLMFLLN
jgi:hypothetical protein